MTSGLRFRVATEGARIVLSPRCSSRVFPPGVSVYYGNQETKFGVNYGGGIKMRLTPIIGLRFDVREYSSGKPFKFTGESGWMNQMEASVGASFLF